MALDEVGAAAIGGKPLVGDGDRLQDRYSAGREFPAQRFKEDRPPFLADRLQHLDRDDAVETALDLPVILQVEIGDQALLAQSRGGIAELGWRQGHPRYASARPDQALGQA